MERHAEHTKRSRARLARIRVCKPGVASGTGRQGTFRVRPRVPVKTAPYDRAERLVLNQGQNQLI